jgi:hypothetical protein
MMPLVNTESLFMKLGFNGMTGSARKTLAALKYYGFVYQPHGTKEAGLTEAALLIINSVLGSKEQNNAIQQAFLSPVMYAYCWQLWGNDDVAEEVMRSHLVLEKSFNAASLTRFIARYRESREFSRIGQNVEAEEASDTMAIFGVGASTQSESQGALHQPIPEKIQEVSDDDKHLVFCDYATGNPIEEFVIVDAPPLSLLEVKALVLTPQDRSGIPPISTHIKQETFTLTEGRVSIHFPSRMSKDDFEDFEDWLDILKRKIKRSIKADDTE